jgi:hypothetical protein
MAKKWTELQTLLLPASDDVICVVDTNVASSKKIELGEFFGNIPANTAITGTLTVGGRAFVQANTVTLTTKSTVASNNATTVLGSGMQGSLFWDDNYLYVATSNTVIKRVALSTFA